MDHYHRCRVCRSRFKNVDDCTNHEKEDHNLIVNMYLPTPNKQPHGRWYPMVNIGETHFGYTSYRCTCGANWTNFWYSDPFERSQCPRCKYYQVPFAMWVNNKRRHDDDARYDDRDACSADRDARSSADSDARTFERGGRTFVRGGRTFERGGRTFERDGRSSDERGVRSSDEREDRSLEGRDHFFDMEDNALRNEDHCLEGRDDSFELD